jgi:hypothetical protein
MDELAARTTSPLQQFGLAINFFFPALALIVLALRLYGKASAKSQGPGTFRHPSTLLGPGRSPLSHLSDTHLLAVQRGS